MLASGNDVEVKLWDAATFKEKNTIQTPANGLLAFAPDGRSLLTGLHFQAAGVIPTVKRWEPDAGKELAALKLEDEQGWVHYRLSPDGKTLAAASYDRADRAALRRGHGTAFLSRRWAYAGGDQPSPSVRTARPWPREARTGQVRLWDAATGKEIRTLLGHTDEIWYVAFGPDGKVVAAGSPGPNGHPLGRGQRSALADSGWTHGRG